MLHQEHFRKADTTYIIAHDDDGNAIHLIEKDGEVVVYPTLSSLIDHQYDGIDVERFYLIDDDFDLLFSEDSYDYYQLKKTYTI